MLVDLEVFYLGHLKNLYTIQYNTIQYGTSFGTYVFLCLSCPICIGLSVMCTGKMTYIGVRWGSDWVISHFLRRPIGIQFVFKIIYRGSMYHMYWQTVPYINYPIPHVKK